VIQKCGCIDDGESNEEMQLLYIHGKVVNKHMTHATARVPMHTFHHKDGTCQQDAGERRTSLGSGAVISLQDSWPILAIPGLARKITSKVSNFLGQLFSATFSATF
jgi:hypothetical protein